MVLVYGVVLPRRLWLWRICQHAHGLEQGNDLLLVELGLLDQALRVAGLGLTYASVFRTWLEDDDAGLARTMAALDRRLRRGQQTLDGLEQFGTAFSRFGAAMQDIVRGATQGRPRKEAGPDTHTP